MHTTTDLVSRLVGASMARPFLVLLAAAVAAILGADALRGLPRDVFPDLSTPTWSVIVQNPAMNAEELEATIAVPLEASLAGLPGVRRIRSTSQLGVAQIVVEFDPDADVARARQLVAEQIAQVELPEGTDPPLLSSLTGRLNEVFEFTLEADPGAADLMTLRDLAEFDVRTRLLAVPGVAAVERLGGFLREFQVRMDPERMAARGITLDEVLHAVDGANRSASGGILTLGATEWTVQATARVERVEDLRETVVAVRGPVPVLLGDVADVVEAPAVRRGMAHRLDGEVVSCRVSKQFGADTVQVGAGLRDAVREIRASLPEGVRLRVVYDQSRLVDQSLSGVGRAVGLGAVFVVLVIFLLLGDARAAALVTLTIPLSLALAGTVLARAGVGLNTMTLGGLAIAVGLLVDASIIVCENVVHRLGAAGGADPRDVSAHATAEVGRPIAAATFVVMAVFLPLFSMEGIEGRTYKPLAAAVIAAMGASLVLALTVTPILSAWALRPRRGPDDNALVRLVKRVYAPVLDASLLRPRLVVAASIGAVLGAVGLGGTLGRDFMPALDEGALLLQTFLPAEASLDQVDRVNHRVEDELRRIPEILDVVRRTGRAERTEDPMPHTVSDVLVLLDPDRTRSIEAIEDEIRERLERVAAVGVSLTTPLGMRIDEGLGGTPADVSVRIFGPDLAVLARLADEVRERIEDVPGLTDLRVEEIAALPRVRIDVDRAAVARVGLTPGEVIDAVRIGLVGDTRSEVRVGSRRYDLVVKLQPERASDVDALRALQIDGHDGTRIPLGKLATIESATGPGAIRREAGARRVAVEGSVAGSDLGSVADAVEARLAEMTFPSGYFPDVGGRVESQDRATRGLARATLAAWLAVLAILYLALGSWRETGVVLATLPVALVGSVLALAVTGETWNVSSIVGLIGLSGIAVQNGLVLVVQTRGLVATGLPLAAAVREASIGRVRPKLMTAATAILGLLPMLVLDLHGTEIERPLAIVLVGGLVTSTLYTLVALPTLYLAVSRAR